jgi:hypothetical protein
MKNVFIGILAIAAIAFGGLTLSSHKEKEKKNDIALGMVRSLADELDAKTTKSGVYIKPDGNILYGLEDPWGTKIKAIYSKGGVMEMIKVSSAGPDRKLGTSDDLVVKRSATNLSGLGSAVKDNVEEVMEKGSKGLMKGLIGGLKEGIKENLGKGKGKEKAD